MNFIGGAAQAATKRRYDEDVQSTLGIWNEGLSQIITDVEAFDIDTDTLHPFKLLLDRTAAMGYANQDLAAVFETLVGRERK